MPASPRFFTISDIANRLDVSSRTVRRWIDDRLLVSHRIRGVVRISEADCGNTQKEHVPTGAIFCASKLAGDLRKRLSPLLRRS